VDSRRHRREVAVVFGTRSEALALAPVVRALRRSDRYVPLVVSTGEQRWILDQVLRPLGLRPDVDLTLPGADAPRSRRTLSPEVVERLGALLVGCRPGAVLVHGDSASAFGAALAAFSEGVRVCHLGAGYRSEEVWAAFEVANQRLIDPLAWWHLVPTGRAAAHLVSEGIAPGRITVTGPTGLDTLRWAASLNRGEPAFTGTAGRRVLACLRAADGDSHRLQAVADILESLGGGGEVVLPRHPDGASDALCQRLDSGLVTVIPPLEYLDYVATLGDAALVVTDSVAVEVEARCLGVPYAVLGDDLRSFEEMCRAPHRPGPDGRGDDVARTGLVLDVLDRLPDGCLPIPGSDGAVAGRAVLGV
jgi:UDP-N-acetylglucosamine 2-epimerase (non-hydrolysing)